MRDESLKRDPFYERIRRMVERDLQAEKERRARFLFRLNMFAYVLFLFIAWVRLFPIFEGFWEERLVPSLVVLSIAGFIQVLIHWAAYRLNTSAGERALRDRLLGSAIRETMDDAGENNEKLKRRIEAEQQDEGDELIDLPYEGWPRETGRQNRTER